MSNCQSCTFTEVDSQFSVPLYELLSGVEGKYNSDILAQEGYSVRLLVKREPCNKQSSKWDKELNNRGRILGIRSG